MKNDGQNILWRLRQYWHHWFHTSAETWKFQNIKQEMANTNYWVSEHRVTCAKCGHVWTAYVAWSRWMSRDLADAKQKARRVKNYKVQEIPETGKDGG